MSTKVRSLVGGPGRPGAGLDWVGPLRAETDYTASVGRGGGGGGGGGGAGR